MNKLLATTALALSMAMPLGVTAHAQSSTSEQPGNNQTEMQKSDSGTQQPATTTGKSSATGTSSQAAGQTSTQSNSAMTTKSTGPATYMDKTSEGGVRASALIGSRVYAQSGNIDDSQFYNADSRKDWEDIGEVNDVVLGWDGSIKSVVLGVGGFLGIGEKDVAVEMANLHRVRDSAESDDWYLVINSSKDALEAAPAFDQPSN